MGETAPLPGAESARGPVTVARPRVTSLLAACRKQRTTLVVAGAGYGKTTALAEVAASGGARWVRLRRADAQAESLSARIAAVLGDSGAPAGSAIASATGSDDRSALAERRAELLCELADGLTDDVLLILDGLEQVGDDPAVRHLLRVLSLEAPSRLHLVLSGRNLPELGLGGAQGRGELLEVIAPDLSYTVGEVAQLIEVRLGQGQTHLAPECWSLTGGWAAALQLLLDRLARVKPGDHDRALSRLRHNHGHLWHAFARELIAGEPLSTRQILSVALLSPRIDAELLAGVALPAANPDLEGLRERGLLVEAGQTGYFRLSPVLEGAVAAQYQPGEIESLRGQVASWLEHHSHLEDALECFAGGPRDPARSFVARRGTALIRDGAAARVIQALRRHGTGGVPDLEAVLAEALQATGDWDAAIELFARVARAADPQGLPAGVAWRYGVLLYLRGQTAASAQILSAAHRPDRTSADDAMVSAWLSTTWWSQGHLDDAESAARAALHQAAASGDSGALAAAHVSCALVAASRGQRERNEQEYRLALAAARDAGDRVQASRIHANLSSRALEIGEYREAIAEAESALQTGAGHRFYSALALSNKAEAHLRLGQLDDARTTAVEAEAIYRALGSLHASVPQVIYGELYRQRADLVRARDSFERARALAEECEDVHTLVFALCGLARVLSEEDICAARRTVAEALARSSSLERASALCVSAEVALWEGDRPSAIRFAKQAEVEARATGDRSALAEALELRAAAHLPADATRLRSAIALWESVDNPVRVARARLALAIATEDPQAADAARHTLLALGVAPALGLPGLLSSPPGGGREVAIITLGRFVVQHGGEPVPLSAWQSRKARDVLKLLVARKGHPITREAAAETMWPAEPTEPLGNRLSVALSIIRKVLDPDRGHPADHYVVADTRSIALRLDRVEVDLIEFLRLTDAGVELIAAGDTAAAEGALQRARQLYAGDFLEEDPYEDWAVEVREEARGRLCTTLRLLARLAVEHGDDESACRYLGQLLDRDPYDENAWLALIAALVRLRHHGEARRNYAGYARRMAELDVVPVALVDTAGRWP